MSDKYSNFDELTEFGFQVNLLGGSGNQGQVFPQSDAEDLSRGLRFIPGEVTVARRNGEHVSFEQPCSHPCCWYWQFRDGSRTYYWERGDYERMAQNNGKTKNDEGNYEGGIGSCPDCGNPRTRGGHVSVLGVEKIIGQMKEQQ